jgi:hypothetical protein
VILLIGVVVCLPLIKLTITPTTNVVATAVALYHKYDRLPSFAKDSLGKNKIKVRLQSFYGEQEEIIF